MLRLAILLFATTLLVSGSVVRHPKLHKTIHPFQERNLKTKAVRPYTAVGTCPVPQGADPVYLPDSKDCTIFYECDAEGNACPKQCPPGTEFNPTLHVCDRPEAAGCTAQGSRFPVPVKPKKISPFSQVGDCHGHEDGSPTYLPDSDKCEIYYECSNGEAIQNDCPDGLQWNPAINSCDFQNNVNCENGKRSLKPKTIQPFSAVGQCPIPQGALPEFLPDSENCSVFYECNEIGVPILKECPSDLQFNPVKKVCDWPDRAGCTAGQQNKILTARRRMFHSKGQ